MEMDVNTEGLPSVTTISKAESTAFVGDVLALLINKENQGGTT